jgi:dihydrofolate reductase
LRDSDAGPDRRSAVRKVVASTYVTLDGVYEDPGWLEWNNSHLLEGDVADAVGKLKEESGQDILMYSSVGLMRALMAEGLVDRFRIWVHPLVLGEGRRLFEDGKRTELELVDTTTLPNGVAVLDYQLPG